MALTVVSTEIIARGCRLFELALPDGAPLPGCGPGAHIGIRLADGSERQYSLLNFGEAPTCYRFVVKRDPESRGGSVWLYEQAAPNDTFLIEAPRNNFPLEEGAHPTVMIAGGIGITPIRAMIDRLEEIGSEWVLHYAARSREEAPFADELAKFGSVYFHFDDVQGEVLPVREIVRAAPARAHLYCCGPAPMLAAFEAATAEANIAPERVHVEYFTQKYGAATEGGFTVALARSGGEIRVLPGQTILDALRAVGLDLSSSCEEGICGACETGVIEGEPDHRDAILSERERRENKTMFICCSGSKGDRLVLDL